MQECIALVPFVGFLRLLGLLRFLRILGLLRLFRLLGLLGLGGRRDGLRSLAPTPRGEGTHYEGKGEDRIDLHNGDMDEEGSGAEPSWVARLGA